MFLSIEYTKLLKNEKIVGMEDFIRQRKVGDNEHSQAFYRTKIGVKGREIVAFSKNIYFLDHVE